MVVVQEESAGYRKSFRGRVGARLPDGGRRSATDPIIYKKKDVLCTSFFFVKMGRRGLCLFQNQGAAHTAASTNCAHRVFSPRFEV